MIEFINTIKQMDSYRNLGVKEQMIAMKQVLNEQFSQFDTFQQFNEKEKDYVLNGFLAYSPTFQNPAIEEHATKLATNFYNDRLKALSDPEYDEDKSIQREMKRWITGDTSVRSTGILPLLTKLTDPIAKAVGRDEFTTDYLLSEDNKKAADFLSEYMGVMGESSRGAKNLGKMMGLAADIAAFQFSFPSVPVASVGGKIVKRTGPQLIGEALSANVKSPFMIKSLRSLVPIATEATVEGFLGTLRDDYLQERDTGEGVFEQGAGEVLKHWGFWALEDFVMGTLATTLLATGGAYIKARKYNKASKEFMKAQKDVNSIVDDIASGVYSPEMKNQLPLEVQDIVDQRWGIKTLMDKGLSKADEMPVERAYYAAEDLGVAVARQPDGRFRYHYLGKDGHRITGQVDNLSETNDFLANRARSQLKDMSDVKKDTFLSAHPEIRQRVKTLDEIDGYFDLKKASDLPEELKEKVSKKTYKGPADRIFVQKQEADFLSSKNVRKVRVDISDEVLNNASAKKHPFAKEEGIRAVLDDKDPNALVVANKTANPEQVSVARAKAQKALMNEGSLNEEMLVKEFLIDGGFDSYKIADDTIVSLFPEKTKLITGLDIDTASKIGDTEEIFRKGSRLSKKSYIESDITGELKTDVIQDARLFSKGLEFVSDNPSPQNVGNLTRMYAKNLDKGYDVRVSKLPKNSRRKVTMKLNEQSKVIEVKYADNIDTAQAKKAFYDDYTKELSRVTQGKKIQNRVPFDMRAVRESTTFTLGNSESTVRWLSDLAKSRRIGIISSDVGGQYKLVSQGPGGQANEIVFDSIDELKNYVVRASYNFEDAKFDLAREGIALQRTTRKGDNVYKAILPDGKVIEEDSLRSVLNQVEFTPARLDINRFGPKVVGIKRDSVQLAYREGTVVGPRSSVLRMLSNFEDKNYVRQLKEVFSNNKGKISVGSDASYAVYVPAVGNTFNFKDLKAARKFLQNDVDSFMTVYNAGLKKGLRVSPKKLGYIVGDGQKTFDADSLDEVKTIIRSYGDPEQSAPSIFKGLDDSIDAQVSEVLKTYNKAEFPKVEQYPYNHFPDMQAPNGEVDYSAGIFDHISGKIATTNKWMEDYTRRVGDQRLMQLFRGVDNAARKNAQIEINRAAVNYKKLFVNPKTKKMLSKDRRQAIFYHLGAQTPEETSLAFSRFGELNGFEQEVAHNVRRVYDALGVKFGIKTQDLIHNYMPRLMRWSEENAELINQMTNAEELFESFSHATGISPDIGFFAKNQRISEVLYFAHQNDALEVLLQYSAKGHKNLYIEPAWRELQSYLMKNKNNIPPTVMNRLNYYKEMLTSSYKSDGMEVVEKIGERFMRNVGKRLGNKKAFRKIYGDSATAEAYGRDLFKTMFSLNYISSMGARPWLAIRNSFQPWTTLAPRFGNEYVMRAIKDVSDLGEDYYKYLNRIGVLDDKPPLTNEILGDITFLGRLAEKSLSWYKSSDAYTRAIAARTAENILDDALTRYSRGVIKTEEQFRKTAQLHKIEGDLADQIMSYVRKGDDTSIATAKAVYMNKLSEDTMFGYRKTEAPQMFTSSIVGKLFGQYGTYSSGYRANLWRGLQNGSVMDRVGFVTRFLGNQLALFGAFTALGISASNFIPGGPAIFTGGPFFDLSLSTLKAMDFTTYEGAQARQELKRNLSYMIPGVLHYSYFKKAIDYAEQGDAWKAWLSLTSTPTINE